MMLKFILSILSFVPFFFTSISSEALPILQPQPGAVDLGVKKFRSEKGFALSAEGVEWRRRVPPERTRLSAVFEKKGSSGGLGALLTVRVDEMREPLGLEDYVRRWMKEYAKYGFQVRNHRVFSGGNDRGQDLRMSIIDLKHSESEGQMRQVITVRNQRAVIMTCRASRQNFSEALPGCNSIIRSFQWLE